MLLVVDTVMSMVFLCKLAEPTQGSCSDVMALVSVALTIWTIHSARPFHCGYLSDDRVWLKYH